MTEIHSIDPHLREEQTLNVTAERTPTSASVAMVPKETYMMKANLLATPSVAPVPLMKSKEVVQFHPPSSIHQSIHSDHINTSQEITASLEKLVHDGSSGLPVKTSDANIATGIERTEDQKVTVEEKKDEPLLSNGTSTGTSVDLTAEVSVQQINTSLEINNTDKTYVTEKTEDVKVINDEKRDDLNDKSSATTVEMTAEVSHSQINTSMETGITDKTPMIEKNEDQKVKAEEKKDEPVVNNSEYTATTADWTAEVSSSQINTSLETSITDKTSVIEKNEDQRVTTEDQKKDESILANGGSTATTVDLTAEVSLQQINTSTEITNTSNLSQVEKGTDTAKPNELIGQSVAPTENGRTMETSVPTLVYVPSSAESLKEEKTEEKDSLGISSIEQTNGEKGPVQATETDKINEISGDSQRNDEPLAKDEPEKKEETITASSLSSSSSTLIVGGLIGGGEMVVNGIITQSIPIVPMDMSMKSIDPLQASDIADFCVLIAGGLASSVDGVDFHGLVGGLIANPLIIKGEDDKESQEKTVIDRSEVVSTEASLPAKSGLDEEKKDDLASDLTKKEPETKGHQPEKTDVTDNKNLPAETNCNGDAGDAKAESAKQDEENEVVERPRSSAELIATAQAAAAELAALSQAAENELLQLNKSSSSRKGSIGERNGEEATSVTIPIVFSEDDSAQSSTALEVTPQNSIAEPLVPDLSIDGRLVAISTGADALKTSIEETASVGTNITKIDSSGNNDQSLLQESSVPKESIGDTKVSETQTRDDSKNDVKTDEIVVPVQDLTSTLDTGNRQEENQIEKTPTVDVNPIPVTAETAEEEKPAEVADEASKLPGSNEESLPKEPIIDEGQKTKDSITPESTSQPTQPKDNVVDVKTTTEVVDVGSKSLGVEVKESTQDQASIANKEGLETDGSVSKDEAVPLVGEQTLATQTPTITISQERDLTGSSLTEESVVSKGDSKSVAVSDSDNNKQSDEKREEVAKTENEKKEEKHEKEGDEEKKSGNQGQLNESSADTSKTTADSQLVTSKDGQETAVSTMANTSGTQEANEAQSSSTTTNLNERVGAVDASLSIELGKSGDVHSTVESDSNSAVAAQSGIINEQLTNGNKEVKGEEEKKGEILEKDEKKTGTEGSLSDSPADNNKTSIDNQELTTKDEPERAGNVVPVTETTNTSGTEDTNKIQTSSTTNSSEPVGVVDAALTVEGKTSEESESQAGHVESVDAVASKTETEDLNKEGKEVKEEKSDDKGEKEEKKAEALSNEIIKTSTENQQIPTPQEEPKPTIKSEPPMTLTSEPIKTTNDSPSTVVDNSPKTVEKKEVPQPEVKEAQDIVWITDVPMEKKQTDSPQIEDQDKKQEETKSQPEVAAEKVDIPIIEKTITEETSLPSTAEEKHDDREGHKDERSVDEKTSINITTSSDQQEKTTAATVDEEDKRLQTGNEAQDNINKQDLVDTTSKTKSNDQVEEVKQEIPKLEIQPEPSLKLETSEKRETSVDGTNKEENNNKFDIDEYEQRMTEKTEEMKALVNKLIDTSQQAQSNSEQLAKKAIEAIADLPLISSTKRRVSFDESTTRSDGNSLPSNVESVLLGRGTLTNPTGVDILPDGNVLITDKEKGILIFSISGSVVKQVSNENWKDPCAPYIHRTYILIIQSIRNGDGIWERMICKFSFDLELLARIECPIWIRENQAVVTHERLCVSPIENIYLSVNADKFTGLYELTPGGQWTELEYKLDESFIDICAFCFVSPVTQILVVEGEKNYVHMYSIINSQVAERRRLGIVERPGAITQDEQGMLFILNRAAACILTVDTFSWCAHKAVTVVDRMINHFACCGGLMAVPLADCVRVQRYSPSK